MHRNIVKAADPTAADRGGGPRHPGQGGGVAQGMALPGLAGHDQPAGYSTMAVLPGDTTAALYEIADTGGIVFTRQSLRWLES